MDQQLTAAGNEAVRSLAQRYGVSESAVATLLRAVANGNGTMAQFYHPELGGGGQWMQGGMTMVGDMFNTRLQSTVSSLCAELSSLLRGEALFAAPAASTTPASSSSQHAASPQASSERSSFRSWWPAELGAPSSTGSQNDSRYAYFPGARRLAISRGGNLTIYDTLDHQIGGVQQQQGGSSGSLSFTSQRGTFTVESLPVVSPAPARASGAASERGLRPPEVPVPPQHVPHVPQPTTDEGVVPSAQWVAPPTAPRGSASTPRRSADSASGSAHGAGGAAHGASGAGGAAHGGSTSSKDVLDALERLGTLRERGVLTEDEFKAKKAELLARL